MREKIIDGVDIDGVWYFTPSSARTFMESKAERKLRGSTNYYARINGVRMLKFSNTFCLYCRTDIANLTKEDFPTRSKENVEVK